MLLKQYFESAVVYCSFEIVSVVVVELAVLIALAG